MKIAVVTGASSGMGRETIIQLWEHFKGFEGRAVDVVSEEESAWMNWTARLGCPCANLHWILQGSVTGTCSCGR